MALSVRESNNRRAQRTRTRLRKLANGRPRLSIFRSDKNIYAQVIDDLGGVTSFVRAHWLQEKCYYALLRFFHSKAFKLNTFSSLWASLCLQIFGDKVLRINDRIILLADGFKAPREGRKMPGVKSLHQESSCNAKAPFIMGHSCQVASLVVRGVKTFFAVPLIARIHEGLVFSNRDSRTLLDKLMIMIGGLTLNVPYYLVADAYYASAKTACALLKDHNHLISRCRSNAVAYFTAPVTPDCTVVLDADEPVQHRRDKFGGAHVPYDTVPAKPVVCGERVLT